MPIRPPLPATALHRYTSLFSPPLSSRTLLEKSLGLHQVCGREAIALHRNTARTPLPDPRSSWSLCVRQECQDGDMEPLAPVSWPLQLGFVSMGSHAGGPTQTINA